MSPTRTTPQNDEVLLARLRDAGVEFVIIGGVCGVYYGVTLATYDLDLCCPFTEKNLMRLQSAISDLAPFCRGVRTPRMPRSVFRRGKAPEDWSTPRRCRVQTSSTRGEAFGVRRGAPLWMVEVQTSCGKLDCLSEVTGIGGYEQVFAESAVAQFPYGEFRVLTLDALIRSKKAAGRDRDLRSVAYLEAIKEKTLKKNKS